MMMTLFAQQINLVSVLIAGILAMVIGYIWYHPKVLGDLWARENGLDINQMDGKDPIPYITMFVGALIMATVLQWVLKATVADTLMSTIRVTVSLWLAFVFVTTAGNYKFSHRSWTLIFIDAGYFLVDLLAMGLIFFYWK